LAENDAARSCAKIGIGIDLPMLDCQRLLYGPYKAPPLERGDRTECWYRDCDVRITTWTDARLPWPRCSVPGQRGGSGLLINEELVRAIQHESAAAIQFWWGVTTSTTTAW